MKADNYSIQAGQAKKRFLTYDQEALIRKLSLKADEDYLYLSLISRPYRICRRTGDMERFTGGNWEDANSFAEVMTLLDLVCDSREDRFLRGRWKSMTAFGLMFHRNLLEDKPDPAALYFQNHPESFCRACQTLGGRALPVGDIAWAIELFDGLEVAVQLWFGDEEFPPNLRILWEENAGMYLKYETMYFALDLLLSRIREEMETQ